MTVDRIESLSQVDIVPGTEILTDVGETTFVHGGHGDVVLVPQPNADPHNPLNWKPLWKYIVLLNCSIYMFMGNFSALSIAPMTPILMKEFNTSETKISLLTGAVVLSLGYANFLIIPCTRIFGRRSVALVCSVVVIAANIWQAVAKSYGSLLGGRVLIGIGAATSESLMPVVIADILFLHERGTWMGVYFWAYFMGAWAGPIVAGTVANQLGWRWFFWISAILSGVLLITMFLWFPETKYHQEDRLHIIADKSAESSNPKLESGVIEGYVEDTGVNMGTHSDVLGKGYPSKSQQWALNWRIDAEQVRFLPRDIVTPIQISVFPVILFSAMVTGFAANSLLVLNLLESPAFSSPVYGFNPGSVGYVNFALMGGGIFGLATAGPMSDWISMFLTKRNKGVREAEMRLLTFIPFLAIGFVGMLIAGWGWDHNYSWPIVVVVGFGFTGVMVMAVPTIAITYAVDSYRPVAGQIMVVATVAKNTFGFGMTYFVNDMAAAHGYIAPIMLLCGLTVGFTVVFGTLLWFFGKACRRLTRNAKVHTF